MSGYVGRTPSTSLQIYRNVEFLMDRKNRRKELIFKDRDAAVSFFRNVEHYSDDDIYYLFWFEEGEDKRRNLLTGELLDNPDPPDWLPEDDILPNPDLDDPDD